MKFRNRIRNVSFSYLLLHWGLVYIYIRFSICFCFLYILFTLLKWYREYRPSSDISPAFLHLWFGNFRERHEGNRIRKPLFLTWTNAIQNVKWNSELDNYLWMKIKIVNQKPEIICFNKCFRSWIIGWKFGAAYGREPRRVVAFPLDVQVLCRLPGHSDPQGEASGRVPPRNQVVSKYPIVPKAPWG